MDVAPLFEMLTKQYPDSARRGRLVARAPGRVNLIGEHVDYNDGYVCPMAIDRETVLALAPRNDKRVRLFSALLGESVEFPIDQEIPREGPAWALYPKGAIEAMRRRVRLGRGFDAVAGSTVPLGGGLSSSAAFEVSTAMAILAVNELEMAREEVALACQWAEHTYPGVPCGIMDQFISALGQAGHAMLLDCRDRTTRQVPLADSRVRIVISNSNVRHELSGGEYAKRPAECETAVLACVQQFPQIRSLRDVSMHMLSDVRPRVNPVTLRRAEHVVTEIQRTQDFAAALEMRDYADCGRLMVASHESLRRDYEVSCPELDALVEIATSVKGVYGARMTGGGFGGCIVALCDVDAVDALSQAIAERYPAKAGGRQATTFATVASAGASVTPAARR